MIFADINQAVRRALRVLVQKRRPFFFAVFLCVIGGVAELIGVGTLYPFLSLLAKPELTESNAVLQFLFQLGQFRTVNQFLIFMGWLALTVFFAASVFLFLKNAYITRFCFSQTAQISTRMLEAYLRKPMLFHVSSNSGALTKDVIAQTDQFTFGVLLSVMTLFADGAVLLMLVGLILWIDVTVGLAVTLTLGLVLSMALILTKDGMHKLAVKNDEANSARYAFCIAALQSIKEIKTTGKESYFAGLFRTHAQDQARCFANLSIMQSTAPAMMQFVAVAAVIGMSLYYLLSGAEPAAIVPTLIVYVVAGYRIMPSLSKLSTALSQLRQLQPAIANISKVLDEFEAVRPDGSRDDEPLGQCHSIELCGIDYSYPGSAKPVIENLQLRIEGNTFVCIVGSSGSGKTTIVDILLGLLKFSQGDVLINDESIRNVSERRWRAMFGYVPQTVYIVDGTIAENIAFGVEPDQVDLMKLQRVVQQCHLDDFIDMRPEGLQARVGELGAKISGGQRQRLGIARALYRDPPILILDESTNSLDGISEQLIAQTLLELRQQKTVIAVAHRSSLVKHCDRVVLIDEGRVVADGVFENLVQFSESFAQLMSEMEAGKSDAFVKTV